ncbi:uncharacterized protein LOC108136014 [Drosophila elegans]|uniref:uncharacterized protein LOC108136014 n=1 Tax=Drosophila elegans TaxID=30023 RepID=UPI0007E868CE|nr:uncharacterized protein LOC108136014 [Drosophila elegans]
MRCLCVVSIIFILCCLSIKGQRLNCSRIRENCEPCIRRLVDPINNLDFINRDCRESVGERWVWRDVRRCDMQIVACENHDSKLDCDTVARLAGMRRRH